jgi:hypothetical protein
MVLMGKSKSSINSGFHAIGYKAVPIEEEHASALIHTFPLMKDNISLTRQWTVGRKCDEQSV